MNRKEQLPTLPDGLYWYTIDGQSIFPIYSASGSPSSAAVAVIVDHFSPGSYSSDLGYGLNDDARGKWFSIRFSPYLDNFNSGFVNALIALGREV